MPEVFSQQFSQPQYSTQYQQNNNNYLRNSSAFRQEIARFEMTVHRAGKQPLSLSQVPRVEEGDVIKVKLLDEAVNGVKIDQSLYNWTMLVAFINPNRKISDGGKQGVGSRESGVGSEILSSNKNINSFADNGSLKSKGNSDRESSVSQEINFRKTGWYKEYSFTVPYDSQPYFFLYPRPGYRGKLLNLINKNYKEIRALGEKTIEIAGAYGQISLFLNELQGVISGNNYGSGYGSGYGSYGTNGYGSSTYYGGSTGGYSPYNPYPNYSNYSSYNQQFNYNLFIAQSVERMARGFNISLPNNCWQGSQSFANSTSYNSYNPYNGYYGSNNGLSQIFQPTISPELVNRLQCVAKNIRLEDFDISVSKLLQQGGMLLALQLQKQYPQLSYWINVAALAIDLIVKITRKSPLRIVPSVASSSDNPNSGSYNGSYSSSASYASSSSYQNNYNSANSGNSVNSANLMPMPKISLFAESQPDDNQFVTAYPIVLHKWQPEADQEIISLRPPILAEPCLHAGVNILKSTDLTDEQMTDTFTKNYLLSMTSTNGFKKEFLLKKNLGLNGWELNISPQDLQEFPKIQMTIESTISGTRGFNEIKTPPFYLPVSFGGSWQMTPESQQNFVVGGRRRITIKNTLGNCQCLQAVIYKPSFGGQFVFEASSGGSSNNGSNGSNNNFGNGNQNQLQYSPDGKEVFFEVDATNFQPGAGEIELRTFGGDSQKIPLKLYPAPPQISDLKLRRGDKEILVTGDRLEQIQSISINGKRAVNPYQTSQSPGGYSSQPNYQQPIYGQSNQTGQPTQPSYGNQPSGYGNQPNSGNTSNSANSPNSVTYPQNTLQSNQKVYVLQDRNAVIDGNQVSLELILDDNRSFTFPQRFNTLPARPTIVANEANELVGTFLSDSLRDEGKGTKEVVIVRDQTVMVNGSKNGNSRKQEAKNSPKPVPNSLLPAPNSLPKDTASIDSNELTITVQNKLTDYNFQRENLTLETGIENSAINQNELPQVKFEVLDTNNLRINFNIPEATKKYLGGKRIRFRIRDRERGDSDWYLIKQTFVRTPQIEAVKCDNSLLSSPGSPSSVSLNGNNPNTVNSPTPVNLLNCLMSGVGLDYISQVSTDGGLNWYPGSSGSLQAQLLSDGTSTVMVPLLPNKKALMIKLRDYPKAEGIFVDNFNYINTVKIVKNPVVTKSTINSNQNQNMNQTNGKLINSAQPISPVGQNQEKPVNSSINKQAKKRKGKGK